MTINEKIKQAKELIEKVEEEEAYPSTPEEIRKIDPNAVFEKTEHLKRLLKRALFYIEYDRRKAHRILDKIIYKEA